MDTRMPTGPTGFYAGAAPPSLIVTGRGSVTDGSKSVTQAVGSR